METVSLTTVRSSRRRGPNWITAAMLLLALLFAASGSARAAETVTYYYTSPQGTVLATADSAGNVLSTADYRPYGTQALGTPEKGPGYSGHVNDVDTGLVYMQARYYDPETGRFLSVDPKDIEAGDIVSFARFSYGGLNPATNIDPDGRQTLPASVYQVDWQNPQTREAAAQYALNMVPGYGLYSCISSGCSSGGWIVAVASTGVSAVGAVGKIGSMARVAQAASQVQRLQAAVKEVHGALDPVAQTRRATAGALLSDGRMVFAGGTRDLGPAQRSVVESLGGDIAQSSGGLHAEQKILQYAEAAGVDVRSISTEGNRAICSMCQSEITQRSGTLVDSHNASW
ncbi:MULTISPECIES: RHS repeat-associated core domain-containing protein [Rhodanobacteraceae]|uniref:RHS repeat-associated core domain-containing protein n=1 Tax=Rhodanobacteraceae TaxID=1775411 RepID=UPI00087E05B5|nr:MULTISPECIES: RHS repeat-associated core domain-containing protein [Rhodanobacteraceae]SDG16370.1 RHS repeat-associated core domain-containing protein [Dyella sp. 333MFSha]SKB57093.1 RHS repeat-associated core domain-containing protein [Luteibacter sp. 22Crub2.1]